MVSERARDTVRVAVIRDGAPAARPANAISGPVPSVGAASCQDLVERVLTGNKRAAAQVISLVENDSPQADTVVRRLFPHTGQAYVMGFTGPPGAGKSSIVDDIVHVIRSHDEDVAVIAVDPNSPFSGGAILGDRIRMMRHTVDSGVFIRSMGARGHLGGLAMATGQAIQVFDAFGVDAILVETVGVGQSELEVARLADTTVVVLMPGLGDGVQTIKAGIMEIADIFVVNKADHPDVQRTMADLRELLRIDSRVRNWTPPIVKTVATREEGIADLWGAIKKHRAFLEESGGLVARREARLRQQIVEIATGRLRRRVIEPSTETDGFQDLLRRVVNREIDPYTAAGTLVPENMGNVSED